MNKLNKILLIDDNKIDNFFHERVIRKFDKSITVMSMQSGEDALDYLTGLAPEDLPDLIFLDINMPHMNGWEFLHEYSKFEEHRKSCVIVVMLSTSEDPEDKERANERGLTSDYKSKPLTEQMLTDIYNKYMCI